MTTRTIFLLLLLSGCDFQKPMTNEQINAAVTYCTDNGMDARHLINGWDSRTIVIECEYVREAK